MHGGVSDREENYAGYERETDGGFYDKKHYLTYIKLADASYNALYEIQYRIRKSSRLPSVPDPYFFKRFSRDWICTFDPGRQGSFDFAG